MTNKEIQEKIQLILLEFIDLCKKNNIQYYAIGGTLLGAVRHQGYIPWDDDIDIGIPRNDYNKFISIANEINSDFLVCCPETDKNSLYSFIKIYHKKTTATENFINPNTKGLWIDVFPIDNTFDTKILSKLHFYTLNLISKIIAIKRQTYFASNKSKFILKILLISNYLLKPIPTNKIYDLQKLALTFNNKKEKKYCGNLLGRWGFKEIVPSYFFKESIDLNFENISIKCSMHFDAYLKNIYGNYMIPPPEDQRDGHDRSGIDLNKGWEDSI